MRVDLFANLHRPEQIRDLIAWGRRLDAEGNRRVGLEPAPCECTPEFGLWYLLRGEWDKAEEFLLDPIRIQTESRPQARKENVSVIGAEYAFLRGDMDRASSILDFLAPSPAAPAEEHGYQPWIMAADLRARIAIASKTFDNAREWIGALDRELESSRTFRESCYSTSTAPGSCWQPATPGVPETSPNRSSVTPAGSTTCCP
ncbi:MAG: hypothetical protein R2849_04265 [Thermomicrobiales bacterium]